MVAVGALRTYGSVMNESTLRPRRRSHTAHRIATATPFGVGKHESFRRFRRCASRPTATLLDACGIKKMWVKTRPCIPGYHRLCLRHSNTHPQNVAVEGRGQRPVDRHARAVFTMAKARKRGELTKTPLLSTGVARPTWVGRETPVRSVRWVGRCSDSVSIPSGQARGKCPRMACAEPGRLADLKSNQMWHPRL